MRHLRPLPLWKRKKKQINVRLSDGSSLAVDCHQEVDGSTGLLGIQVHLRQSQQPSLAAADTHLLDPDSQLDIRSLNLFGQDSLGPGIEDVQVDVQ